MHAHGPGLAALLGADEDTQQLVDDYDEYVHPDDRPAFDVAWRYADLLHRDGEVIQQEYRLVGVDGVARWVRDRAAITVLDGRVLLTGAVRDISDQRRAEDERAEALRRLEWLSSVDALTELFNRRHFSEVLRAGSRARLPGRRSHWSTSTISSASTTRTAIRSATSCCARSRAASRRRHARAT